MALDNAYQNVTPYIDHKEQDHKAGLQAIADHVVRPYDEALTFMHQRWAAKVVELAQSNQQLDVAQARAEKIKELISSAQSKLDITDKSQSEVWDILEETPIPPRLVERKQAVIDTSSAKDILVTDYALREEKAISTGLQKIVTAQEKQLSLLKDSGEKAEKERDDIKNRLTALCVFREDRITQLLAQCSTIQIRSDKLENGIAKLAEALYAIKQRIAFIGWPNEQMWGDDPQRLQPDWRKEIAQLEEALSLYTSLKEEK